MASEICLRLEAAALRMKRAAFGWTLSEILGCDARCGQKIVEDESGDALSLAFISLGVPREICARIFLVAFPKVALSRETFERNLALIASLPRRDAARVIAAIAGAARRGPPGDSPAQAADSAARTGVPDDLRRAASENDG
jgi:hypothetical protein